MKRVMIVGAPGSGKSTLARLLGERTGLPVFHMDHIHHLPNWQPRPLDEKHQMAHEIESTDRWIFEGGMSTTYDTRIARADTLIFLDLPVLLRLWRVTARLWQNYGQTRPDMAEGCVETLGWHTLEFYIWIFKTRKPNRNRVIDLINRHDGNVLVHHLNSRRAVDDFITNLTK